MSIGAKILALFGLLNFAEPADFDVGFKDQIDYFRQKVSLPSKGWRDLEGRAHDRAFVVAGVEREDVLADIRQAVDAGIAKGETLEQFQKRFDRIVEQKGWIGGAGGETEARRAWRARVIYETNVRTSYMAGRLKQMRDPDVLKTHPYWEYVHAELRVPEHPREDHLDWDGLILAHDDPWWEKHFPPNGWLCSCGVRPVTRSELARRRAGRTTPDPSPPVNMRKVRDPRTGEWVDVPEGIDFGWDHQPGDSWEKGLVPPELQQPLVGSKDLPAGRHSPKPDHPLPPLADLATPSSVPTLPGGKSPEYYVDAVLDQFDAKRGPDGAVAWRDKSGAAIVISEDMFKDGRGNWKVTKRERATEILKAAEAIRDPDEIWVDWERNSVTGKMTLRRRYLKMEGGKPSVAVFEWGRDGWQATTVFQSDAPDDAARTNYANNQRHGAMLYRRSTEKRGP